MFADLSRVIDVCTAVQPLVHELRITNQVMYVNPPVEDAQYQLLQELFAWEAIVTMLPRIQHSRYQVGICIVCCGALT